MLENVDLIRNDINNLRNDIMNRNSNNNNNNKSVIQTKILSYGRYEGEIKNNLMEGKGTLYYNDGNRYEGEFHNNNREGKGILFFQSGSKYIGEYKNGKANGKGILYFFSGNRFEGEFKNDIRDGKGILYYKMVINMMEIGKIMLLKEREFIIIIVEAVQVIYMKVSSKMENLMEKEFSIIETVLDKWEIF